MKYKALVVLAFVLNSSSAFADSVDVFVLAGQSNMQGFKGNAAQYPTNNISLDGKIMLYWVTPGVSDSGGAWLTMRPQKGRYPLGHFGPEVGFGRCLASNGYRPWIIKYSLGNTSVATDWRGPGDQGMYDEMKAEIINAERVLKAQGYKVKFRSLVWVQGESDAKNKNDAGLYKERLKKILVDFRTEIAHDQNMPIVLGVDEMNPNVVKNPEVLAAQKEISNEMGSVRFSSMIGLEKADVTHLTPESIVVHGERICQEFLNFAK